MAIRSEPSARYPLPSPLVKWAGGKRQLLPHLLERAPLSCPVYHEPFVGGGALLAELYRQRRIRQAVISDLNPALYNLYLVVQSKPADIIQGLADLPFDNTSCGYYAARVAFNQRKNCPPPDVRAAALFLYLNRHCYNGLWRVNSRGDFNVPFGRYKNPLLPARNAITAFHLLLQHVEVCQVDFEQSVAKALPGDFVYFDPPYQPVSATSYFTGYTTTGFSEAEQVRLGRISHDLARRGVLVMLSNSDTSLVRELYSDFHVTGVTAQRAINSRADKRTGASELIITSY